MTRHDTPIAQISAKVDDLAKQASDLYDLSENFPAVNRNVVRILASIEMLKINVEQVTGPADQ
jgi:hypothetical protein